MYPFPSRGIAETDERRCDEHPPEGWRTSRAGPIELRISADSPAGSGRYWILTIAQADSGGGTPRGFCLHASTLGWRTLQAGGAAPVEIRWLEDHDRDGLPELIEWISFPLVAEASGAEYGLAAWVYEFDGRQAFRFDRERTIALAREVLAAYQRPVTNPSLQRLRALAADVLREIVDGSSCALNGRRSR